MYRIVTLVENTTSAPEYRKKHGLCLLVETERHRLLFDVGPDGVFLENARTLGIDPAEIDTVVLSHGHCDHVGGLKEFLRVNQRARIYVRAAALEPHFIRVCGIPISVGMECPTEETVKKRFVFTDSVMQIDEELTVFSDVSGSHPLPSSNRKLFAKRQGRLCLDDFCHEQNLLLMSGGESVLICGCSHAGIANIQHRAEEILGSQPEVVVGGFHLFNPPTHRYESRELILQTAEILKKTKSRYYTCHCTGEKAYREMKPVLGDRLQYLATGSVLLQSSGRNF